MGAADHHQAVSLLGQVTKSFPQEVTPTYRATLEAWQTRARHAVNGRIGYVPGTIEHRFHGAKQIGNTGTAGRCSCATASTR